MQKHSILETLESADLKRLVSRREAMKAGLMTSLAMGSIPLVLAAMAREAGAQTGTSVTDVLNFALTLEYLESEFYDIATGQTALPAAYTGSVSAVGQASTPTAVFTEIAKHENAHVDFLKGVLGAAAVSKPTFDFTGGSGATDSNGKFTGPFGDVFSNPVTFLALSQAFEDTGVRAYKGGAPLLVSSLAALEGALRIHSIEARHASKVRRLRGEKGWISTTQNAPLPAAANVVYGPGNPASQYPAESNTTQAGVNVATLPNVAGATAAAEAFDEPLDMNTVLTLAGLFIQPV